MSLSIKTPSGRAVVAGLYDSKSTTQASQIYYDNKDTKIAVSNMQKALDYVLMNNNAGEEFENKGWFDRPLDDLEWSKADREDFFRTNFNSIKDHITGTISDINVQDFITFYNTYETNRIVDTEEIARSFRDFIFENMCLSEDETELRFKQELVQVINNYLLDYSSKNPKNFYYHYMYSAHNNSAKNFVNAIDYNIYKNFINSLDKEKYPFIIFRYCKASSASTVVLNEVTYHYRASVIVPKDEYVNINAQGFYMEANTSTIDLDENKGNTSSNNAYYSFDNKGYNSVYSYYDEYCLPYDDYATETIKSTNNSISTVGIYALRNLTNIIVKDYSSTTSLTFLTLNNEREVVKVYKSVASLSSTISNDALKIYGFTKSTDTYDKNVYTINKNKILNGNDNYSIITQVEHKSLNGDEIQAIVDELLEEDTYQVPNKELKPNTYSTDEVKIGDFLGKPLYRKIFRTTQALTTSNAVFSSIVVENAEIKKVDFICNTTTNGIWYISGQGRFNDDGKLYGRGLSNSGAINYIDVILEYTKVGD